MKAHFAARTVGLSSLFAAMILAGQCDGQYRTTNFVVHAQQPALAKQVGDLAEQFRKELAELWLGSELPSWPQPCPITVEVSRHAGGETSFAFSPGPNGKSQPFDWRMKIYGSPERILDSVLPHEVTHTIFATHYGRPLPRWADEGACTTVEHEEEKTKNHQMLLEFLTSNRGIPFNHMFAMKQYPRDILPLLCAMLLIGKIPDYAERPPTLRGFRGRGYATRSYGPGASDVEPGCQGILWIRKPF